MISTDGTAWPLTGREAELRSMAGALSRAGGVVLAGPAGVGKTRLARAALADRTPDRVRWVAATESSREVPLAAFVPVLGEELSGATGALPLAAAHAALRMRSHAVLGVDDAHLLDDVSATLLHQLAVAGETPMVVTVRTGAPAPAAVTALWKDGLLARLDLSPLTGEQTGALVGAVLGGRLDGDSIRRLHAVTAGNVLWLRHLVDGELAAGRFVETAGVWHWADAPRITPALAELIDTRIGAQPPGVGEVLELLAIGEPLGVPLLEKVVGPVEVEDAVARGLVTVDTTGPRWEARLAHPLYGEVLRARSGPMRARRLRGILVEAMAAPGGWQAGDVLRRAVLALESDLAPEPGLLFAAAARALELTDLPLAERLLRGSCAAAPAFDPQLTLAFTLGWQFRAAEAEQEYAAAAALATTEEQRVRVAHARASNLYYILNRLDDAEAVLADVERVSPAAALDMQGMRAHLAVGGDRLADAERAARRVLDAGRTLPQAEAYAAWALLGVLTLTGRHDEAPALAGRAVAAALRAPETAALQVNIAYWELFGLGLAGRPGLVRERIAELGASLTGRFLSLFLPVLEGWLALVEGRPGPAARLLAEFRPHFPGSGGGWTTILETTLAHALGMCGDVDGAREAVRRAQQGRHPGIRFEEPRLTLAQAWATAAEGAVSLAVERARRAAAQAAGSGQWAVEVLARQTAVGFGDRAQAARLAELARRVDGPRAPAAAEHARALADGDVEALLLASERFESAGVVLSAAEAAAQAAELCRQRHDLGGQAAAARRAALLAASCEGARTPALVAAARPFPITEREREVATLAAAPLSNREIALRLGISVRTVEGHVYRACTKLGVGDRAALAALVAGVPDERLRDAQEQ
ncbi:LuxR C-terminal-related transcriptional regulator [Pseudonocardia acidicola]|uniref:AAA family ATPase n=1 Tax=Pseudonocardia acidicola TaxID=2724939 RepID=A0ABX1S2C8_9PSEU|nr:AAA family ATPase [Pseudonocardia acidicola]